MDKKDLQETLKKIEGNQSPKAQGLKKAIENKLKTIEANKPVTK